MSEDQSIGATTIAKIIMGSFGLYYGTSTLFKCYHREVDIINSANSKDSGNSKDYEQVQTYGYGTVAVFSLLYGLMIAKKTINL